MPFLALPKELHPDFRFPFKKPINRVELDLSNPITKDLVVWLIFDGRSNESRYTLGGNARVKYTSNTDGLVLDIPGGTNDQIKPRAPLSGRGKDMTILGMANYDDLGRDHAMFDINNQDLLIWADTEAAPTRLRTGAFAGVAINGTSGELGSTTANPNKSFIWGAQVRQNGTNADAQIWLNGKITVSWANIGNRGFDASTNWSVGCNFDGTTKVSNGQYTFVFIWMRTLDNGEMRSMSSNPYQIFEPSVNPSELFWYSGGWSVVDVDLDESVFDGQTGVVVTLSGTVSASGKRVFIQQGSDIVEQSVTAQDASSCTITVSYGGVLTSGAATLYVYNPF